MDICVGHLQLTIGSAYRTQSMLSVFKKKNGVRQNAPKFYGRKLSFLLRLLNLRNRLASACTKFILFEYKIISELNLNIFAC